MGVITKPPVSVVRDIKAEHALDFNQTYGDFRDDLIRDGYAVIKGAVPEDRAAQYVDEVHEFLGSVNLGYDRNDPSTIRQENLPMITEKGMIQGYGVCHEKFVWDIRQEPGVVEVFEKVYGTEDLICSFDAINVSFPNRKDLPPNKPWGHQDQDPDRPGFRCLQGLVNLLPNGPNDGGLIIAKGGHLLSEEFHKAFAEETRIWQWTNEWYGFTDAGMAWLQEKGLEWVKVEAGPGDLIVWDSRAPHYNCSPTSDESRMAVYVCMMPQSSATQEELLFKKQAFENRKGTTHWPQALQMFVLPVLRNGELDPHNRPNPSKEPVFTERGFKLTGIPYIKA